MKWILFAVTTFVFIMETNAQQREDFNLRGERTRVQQGIQSGEITKAEAAKINREKRDVQIAKKSARADGIVTKGERKVIARQDRQLDKTIYRTKHNSRRR